MAIAFGRGAANSAAGASPRAVSVVINLGETVVVHVTFDPTSLAVTGVTDNGAAGGSTYTKRGEKVQGSSVKIETWSTSAGGAKAATAVSVAFSGSPTTDIGVEACAYTGVLGIGQYATGGAATGAATVSITTQDANNFVALGAGWISGINPTQGTGTIRLSDSDVSIAQGFLDHTVASPGVCSPSFALPNAAPWAAGALELRSTAGTVVTPGLGAATAAGFAATVAVTLNKIVSIGAAVLTLSGFAPNVDAGIRINDVLLHQGYSPTPNDPVLSNNMMVGGAGDSGPVQIDTLSGDLSATGFGPTVNLGIAVAPSVGQATLTGLAPTAAISNNKNVPISLGQLTATGFGPTASVSNNINIPVGLGVLTATGQAPTAQLPKNVTPGLGAVTATGQAPTVLTPRNVVAGLGAVTATGFNPTPNIGVNLSIGLGQATATGFAPIASVTNNKQLLPGTGAVAVTGNAPTVSAPDNKVVVAGTGQLIATGLAPTILGPGTSATPGRGEVIATGYAPMVGGFTLRITGGSVLEGILSGGGVLVGTLTGSVVLEGELVGGPF